MITYSLKKEEEEEKRRILRNLKNKLNKPYNIFKSSEFYILEVDIEEKNTIKYFFKTEEEAKARINSELNEIKENIKRIELDLKEIEEYKIKFYSYFKFNNVLEEGRLIKYLNDNFIKNDSPFFYFNNTPFKDLFSFIDYFKTNGLKPKLKPIFFKCLKKEKTEEEEKINSLFKSGGTKF